MPGANVRLATFNVENLFARYRFESNFDPTLDGFTINDLAFDILNETEKQITGRVIRELDADILCLVEVENMAILERFNASYLARLKYRHRILIDGNDPRNIDVAVLSRHPVAAVRTNRHLRNKAKTAPLFARDCLELDFSVVVDEQSGETRTLTVLVNHFKSMMGGRKATQPRRREQVEKVIEIVGDRFGPAFDGNFAVVGDFNDYMEGETALSGLVDHPQLVNSLDRSLQDERWTHYFAKGGDYRQLDYVLLGRAFDQRAGNPVPMTVRKGLPWRADEYDGPRYEEVGENEPKASDHVPLAVDIPRGAFS